MDRLADVLKERGRKVHTTREPSIGPIGKLLRSLLSAGHALPDGRPVGGDTMALLFAADRKDHIEREVLPALEKGYDVISDRYVWSSLAYQAAEADRVWVESLARGLPEPDLTVFLDVPVHVAASRRAAANRATERYDADAYLTRVRDVYAELARRSERAIIVSGDRSPEQVTASLCDAVSEIL